MLIIRYLIKGWSGHINTSDAKSLVLTTNSEFVHKIHDMLMHARIKKVRKISSGPSISIEVLNNILQESCA